MQGNAQFKALLNLGCLKEPKASDGWDTAGGVTLKLKQVTPTKQEKAGRRWQSCAVMAVNRNSEGLEVHFDQTSRCCHVIR